MEGLYCANQPKKECPQKTDEFTPRAPPLVCPASCVKRFKIATRTALVIRPLDDQNSAPSPSHLIIYKSAIWFVPNGGDDSCSTFSSAFDPNILLRAASRFVFSLQWYFFLRSPIFPRLNDRGGFGAEQSTYSSLSFCERHHNHGNQFSIIRNLCYQIWQNLRITYGIGVTQSPAFQGFQRQCLDEISAIGGDIQHQCLLVSYSPSPSILMLVYQAAANRSCF